MRALSSSASSSPNAASKPSNKRVKPRNRPSPRSLRAASKDVSGEEEGDGDSPHSAPHMSISLFLDTDSSVKPATPSSRPASAAARSPPRTLPASSTQPLLTSPTSSAISSLPSPEQSELYFQSGDVIFVVPPPPAADYNALAASFTSVPPNFTSLSPNSTGKAAAATTALLASSTVLYPSAHLVHVYVLPSLLCISTLRGHDSAVEQVYHDEWCDASDAVITQTALGSVYVWSLSTGELLQRMEAKSEWLSAFLMTRRLFPLASTTQVSALMLDDSLLPAAASSASDDEDEAMLSGASATVCVYENQRFYPLLGWSSKLLPTDRPPFSNARGSRELSKEQFRLLPRWRWTAGWEVLRDDTTDVEGWSYAIDFSSTSSRTGEYRGVHRKAFIHSVRRRKWVRHRQTTHAPTAQALASATLDDYIEHKQSTPLLTTPAVNRSLSHSPPQLLAQLADKPRSTPLLSPTPIQTRNRKSKPARHADRLTADEPRILTRPTSRSSASDQEPPVISLSASTSPSPRSAHVPLVSSSTTAAATSASNSPSLPSPHTRRRQVSASQRDGHGVATSSSPPASPSTLNSVLSRVQPSDELKQSIKRMLLSHNRTGTLPSKPTTPSPQTAHVSTIPSSTAAAPSKRLRAPRAPGKVARSAANGSSVDERYSRSSQALLAQALTAADEHSKPGVESKEADDSSLNAQHTPRVKERKEAVDGAENAQTRDKEAGGRKKPISYNTLPSPPRSSSVLDLTIPSAASLALLPPSPPLSPAAATPRSSSAVRVSVYENQRNYPVLGWSSRLLPTDPYPPYSDASGHVLTFEMCELLLPLDMDWLGEWTVRRSSGTDADGWQYAVDWSWEWSGKQRVLTTVRRRCWVRDKAVRRLGHNAEGSRLDRVRRRKQLGGTLPATPSGAGKRRGSGAGVSGASHSRSQSLYAPAALPTSASVESLSTLVSGGRQSSAHQPRRASLSANAEPEQGVSPFYDPSAGEPEEL